MNDHDSKLRYASLKLMLRFGTLLPSVFVASQKALLAKTGDPEVFFRRCRRLLLKMQKASFKERWPKLIFTYLCMYPNNGATLLKELPEIRLVAAFRSSGDAFAMETRTCP